MKTKRHGNRLNTSSKGRGEVKNRRSMKAGSIFYSTKWYPALAEQNHFIALGKKTGIKFKKVYLNATEANLTKLYLALSDSDIDKLRNELKEPSTWADYFVLYGLKHKKAFPFRDGVFTKALHPERRLFLELLNKLQSLDCFTAQFKHRWFRESKIAQIVRAEEKVFFKEQLSFVRQEQPMMHCMDKLVEFRNYYDVVTSVFEDCLSTVGVKKTDPVYVLQNKITQKKKTWEEGGYECPFQVGQIVALTSNFSDMFSKDGIENFNLFTTYICQISKIKNRESYVPTLYVHALDDKTQTVDCIKSGEAENEWYCVSKFNFSIQTITPVQLKDEDIKIVFFTFAKLKNGDKVDVTFGRSSVYKDLYVDNFLRNNSDGSEKLTLKSKSYFPGLPIEASREVHSPFFFSKSSPSQPLKITLMNHKDKQKTQEVSNESTTKQADEIERASKIEEISTPTPEQNNVKKRLYDPESYRCPFSVGQMILVYLFVQKQNTTSTYICPIDSIEDIETAHPILRVSLTLKDQQRPDVIEFKKAAVQMGWFSNVIGHTKMLGIAYILPFHGDSSGEQLLFTLPKLRTDDEVKLHFLETNTVSTGFIVEEKEKDTKEGVEKEILFLINKDKPSDPPIKATRLLHEPYFRLNDTEKVEIMPHRELSTKSKEQILHE